MTSDSSGIFGSRFRARQTFPKKYEVNVCPACGSYVPLLMSFLTTFWVDSDQYFSRKDVYKRQVLGFGHAWHLLRLI